MSPRRVDPSRQVTQVPVVTVPLKHSDPQARRRLGNESKPKFTIVVEVDYNFKASKAPASIIYNMKRAQELLSDMNFIYPVRPHHLSL